MKKITSVFCALAMIWSVNAAPRLHAPKAKSDKQQLEQRLAHAKNDKERDELTYKYKQLLKAQPAKAVRAPRAKHEAQQVTIDRYSYFISGGTSIQYGLHNEELNMHFFYQFPLAEGAHNIEFGKTYTLEEMEADGCEWDEYNENDDLVMHYYTAATFTITKGEGFDIHIAATATDDQGNEYSFAYDEEPVEPTGETVEVSVSRPLIGCDYNETDGYWLLRAQDNTYFVQLEYFSQDGESPAGSFGANDIEFSSTYLEIQTGVLDEYDEPVVQTIHVKDATINVTVNDGRTDVTGSMLGEDGVRYNITLFYATPVVESQENFIANDLSVDTWAFDAWGEIQIFASTSDGKSLSFDFYGNQEEGIPGTYMITPLPGNMNGGSVSVNGEQFAVYSGSVTVAYENDEYSVTGTILCWNNVEYTLTLSEPEVVVSEKNFTSEAMVLDIYPADRFFEVSGFDADGNYLLLTINSATVAGDFASEVDGEYTYAEINGENYVFVSAENIHTTYADGKATVTGTLRLINENNKYDVVDLALDLQAGPYVPSTRNVTLAQMYHANAANDAVGYSFVSEDGMQMFTFIFAVDMWDEDLQLDKTYSLADMDPQQSVGRNAAEREYVVYQSVSFVKTATESGVKIEISILDTRGNIWNLIYEGEDTEYEALFVELGQANAFSHADGGVEYEMIDTENTFSCHLVIEGELGMEDVVIDSLYLSANGGIDLERSYLSIRKVEYKIAEAAFRKEAEGEEVWVSADITDERGYKYMLRFHDDGFNLTGDTIQISFNAEVEATYYEDDYSWRVYAEGTNYIAAFAINGNENDLIGTHVYDVNEWSSHIEILIDEEESNWEYIGIHSIEYVTISDTENGYALEAEFVGEDGNVYVVSVHKWAEAIDNTLVPQKAAKILRNGQIVIIKNGVEYTVQGALLK